jgi:HEAT repeat protein
MRHYVLGSIAAAIAVACLVRLAVAGQDPAAPGPDKEAASATALAADEAALKAANIPTDQAGLIEFFRKRTAEGADKDRLQQLATELGDDSFDVRERASAQLVAAGIRAKSILTKAKESADPEVVFRAKECLRKIEQGATSLVISAAARLLARKSPDNATELLLAYLPTAEDENVADDVRATLATLAMRDGQPDRVLVAALTDKRPLIRSGGAIALCRGGATAQMPAVRKLLQDADPTVRMQVGLALAAVGEKEALPTLIDLLADLPPQETASIEDLLYHVAADKAPAGDGPADAAARRRYRDDWKKWWDAEGGNLDVTKLQEASKTLGYTLVLLLDQGKVMELDAANRPRWTVEGLEFPLDVQYLPDDRLLSAEHNGNRVTEREVKTGKVVWEHKVSHPLVAQRLANGNTFIASQIGLSEVNRAGAIVWEYTPTNGESIMKAQKLRNGDIAMVAQLGGTRYVQLSHDGKTEKRGFTVNLHTSGGRIDVLPNGNVLVPENASNRVVELEPAGAMGRVVWEAMVDSPVAAIRLPNGHTLVTSMNPARGAVEVDRAGKEVWTYKSDTRVTRALRR